MKKKCFAFITATMLGVLCITSCGNSQGTKETTHMTQAEVSTTQEIQNIQTDLQNQKVQENHTVILVVSFGTSYNENRDQTIGAIEETIAEAFPDYEVRRAFTSQIIIDKLKERDGLEIDNVEEALDRAVADGVTNLVVQPTHLMDGYEYMDLSDALEDYKDKFEQIVLGEPLLSTDADFDAVIEAITEKTASYDDGETAICFMGHGTEADSNRIYPLLQQKLKEKEYKNYYIGTVEAEPTLEDILVVLQEEGIYKRVILEPLMVVAGDHANNDMAGEEEDSWKTVLEKEGYQVECLLEGLGQISAIREIYTTHTQAALDRLTE